MAKPAICSVCATAAVPAGHPGSGVVEVILWCLGLLPGFIYSIWRRTSTVLQCPTCSHKDTLVPLSSPLGQQLQARSASSTGAATSGKSLNLVPTPELLVSLWPSLFGLGNPSGFGHEHYSGLAAMALAVVALELRREGAITIKYASDGKRDKATIDFGTIPSDLGEVATQLLSSPQAKPGVQLDRFLEGLRPGQRSPIGFMTMVWQSGVARGFYTVTTRGAGRNKVFTPVASARSGADAAAQELANRYKSVDESEPELAAELRSAASRALPIPRKTEFEPDD